MVPTQNERTGPGRKTPRRYLVRSDRRTTRLLDGQDLAHATVVRHGDRVHEDHLGDEDAERDPDPALLEPVRSIPATIPPRSRRRIEM